MTTNNPVRGIMPQSAHDFLRAQELARAIVRYMDNGQWPASAEWARELKKLCVRYEPAKLSMSAGMVNFVDQNERSADAEV